MTFTQALTPRPPVPRRSTRLRSRLHRRRARLQARLSFRRLCPPVGDSVARGIPGKVHTLFALGLCRLTCGRQHHDSGRCGHRYRKDWFQHGSSPMKLRLRFIGRSGSEKSSKQIVLAPVRLGPYIEYFLNGDVEQPDRLFERSAGIHCPITRHPNICPGKRWCGREDSNFHGFYPTATSTLRVYQFRHDRMIVCDRHGCIKSRPRSQELNCANVRY